MRGGAQDPRGGKVPTQPARGNGSPQAPARSRPQARRFPQGPAVVTRLIRGSRAHQQGTELPRVNSRATRISEHRLRHKSKKQPPAESNCHCQGFSEDGRCRTGCRAWTAPDGRRVVRSMCTPGLCVHQSGYQVFRWQLASSGSSAVAQQQPQRRRYAVASAAAAAPAAAGRGGLAALCLPASQVRAAESHQGSALGCE